MKLSLKGERDASPKSAFIKRPYPPGVHGKKRSGGRGPSEYGTQLLEKQKLKWSYGVFERQFKKYFLEAQKERGVTAQKLVERLERRLDNVIYRLGFAPSRAAARQIVTHGHILVNDRRVTIPSAAVNTGDVVGFTARSRTKGIARDLAARLKKYNPPAWLSLDKEQITGSVAAAPSLEEAGVPSDIQKIVEFYSR